MEHFEVLIENLNSCSHFGANCFLWVNVPQGNNANLMLRLCADGMMGKMTV